MPLYTCRLSKKDVELLVTQVLAEVAKADVDVELKEYLRGSHSEADTERVANTLVRVFLAAQLDIP
jgi:hypothetical protein